MAGRSIIREIALDRAAGSGSVAASAETAVMLTGGDRNVTPILTGVHPQVTGAEVQTDGVAVQGTAAFDVLYTTVEGDVRSRSAQAGFAAVIPVQGAAPKGGAKVLATVTGASVGEKDGRLELAAELSLECMVTEHAVQKAAEGLNAQEEMAQKMGVIEAVQGVKDVQRREMFAESFPLGSDTFTRVVQSRMKTQVDNVLLMDGAVEVSGSVTAVCLMAGMEAAHTGWQTERIPFVLEIADDELRSGMTAVPMVRTRDADCRVVFSTGEDGETETGSLHIEYVLEVSLQISQVQRIEVLEDAYPLSDAAFEAAYAEITFIDDIDDAEQSQYVDAVIELPEDVPQIQDLIGAFAVPSALDVVGGEDAAAEGLMRITLLYRGVGAEGLSEYEQETPFAVTFDRISGLSQVLSLQVGDVEVQRISPTQAQVRVELEMEGRRIAEASARVVQEVSFEGEPVSLPDGAVLYYPEAQESLWDTAKRYRISEEELRRRNPDGQSPILVYRRLTGF